MGNRFREDIRFYSGSIRGSYSQVFFSDNPWLALLVLLASFLDPYTGLSGFLAALSTVLFAKGIGLNPLVTKSGAYSYNSLLVGLTLGVYFKFSIAFIAVLLLSSYFTLLITIWISFVLAKYRIPFLSLPFMLSIWIILLAAKGFGAIQLNERGIYSLNELWNLGGPWLVSIYENSTALKLPLLIEIYLKSLGAIFFQYNIISGILIAIGLLIYSRIAFSLSIVGFLSGYFFCYFLQGNLSELQYSYIGFNYILSAIALGGFYLIPSARSYLMALLSGPLIGLLIGAFTSLLAVFHLPVYSLPFSLAVILMLVLLNNRYILKGINLVQFNRLSPEKNLYSFHTNNERFKNDTYFHIHLPFYSEWQVSQGIEGELTHKGDWRFAWDFVVADQNQKTFRLPGKEPSDFFCYGLPVLAPAAGYVVTCKDGVVENPIGEVNLHENWGNSIVIKHADYLYSQISHIKNGSFKVKTGDYVQKGDLLALCGNSGRSPEPHLHFQLQASSEVGSKTISYPICYFISRQNGKYRFHSFDCPVEGQVIQRPAGNSLIQNAFNFKPGQRIEFEVSLENNTHAVRWEVVTDINNLSYIYCQESKSIAYFSNNGTLHYFKSFEGDKDSLLHYFFLGAHKIVLSYFQDLEIQDVLEIEGFHSGVSKFIQDFAAPFRRYLTANYTCICKEIDNSENPERILLVAKAQTRKGTRLSREITFDLELSGNRLSKILIREKGKCITATRLN